MKSYLVKELDYDGELHKIYAEVYSEDEIKEILKLTNRLKLSPIRNEYEILVIDEIPSLIDYSILNGTPYEQKRIFDIEKVTTAITYLDHDLMQQADDLLYNAGMFE